MTQSAGEVDVHPGLFSPEEPQAQGEPGQVLGRLGGGGNSGHRARRVLGQLGRGWTAVTVPGGLLGQPRELGR